jgi:hypothetical protein
MSSYVKPQVLVFQEFSIVPTEITEPLRAHVAGPHAILHRYSVADEKKTIKLGEYQPLYDTCYPWPQRLPGSIVDQDYVKVYVDNALLNYYSHDLTDSSATVTAVAGKSNWIEADTLAFKTNGPNVRSGVFNQRDVQLGDVVYLRSVTTVDDTCVQDELWTEVTGFASTNVASRIKPATRDTVVNQATVLSTASVPSAIVGLNGYNYLQIAGPKNCVKLAEVDGSDYTGLASGNISETYTIQVVKSSVTGCESSARLRIRSASGRDDVVEVAAPALGDDFEVGTRGLTVKFALDPSEGGTCGDDADDAGVPSNVFVVGQKWEVSVRQAFTQTTATAGTTDEDATTETVDGELRIVGGYTGAKNDVYVVEVTKGGTVSPGGTTFPEVTVSTVKGLDFSGPHEVTAVTGGEGELSEIAIGSHGVTITFTAPSGFRKGDKFYIPVVSSAAGHIRRLILRDDLTPNMIEAEGLDLKLYIKDNIQVSKNRIGYAPQTNYWFEDTQVCIQEGIIAYHPEWTAAGVEQPLNVVKGDVYVEYREWLADLADEVNSISDVADLDNIAGQLDPDNPLKWGVYKALSNSNGTVVKYTAVANPKNLDSWVQVLERIKGRDDLYNLVPLTFDRQVQNLWAAHVGAESNEYANNWKGGFFALRAEPNQLLVGEGATIAGVLANVIEEAPLATLSDDPNATGDNQFTLLQVPTGTNNAKGYFITNNVQPGDIVRYNYSTDGFGEEQYQEYVVDRVLSENSLLLYTSGDSAVTQAQRFEIWHNRNRNEIADHVAEQAGSLSNRRICAVWPDQVGEAGVVQPGYYLAAALAGLVSGVVPHQPLTNVEVAGFDDFTRSYKYFNETQLNRMAEAGVWIVTEDKDGTPHTRHALTTDNLDLNRREEMIRRNVDSMSYLFLRRLKPYIGRTNAQPGMVQVLQFEVNAVLSFLRSNGVTRELGSQLTSGSIRTLQIHPLLKDRIEIVLDLVVPAPLNNIELHLVV